MGHEKGKPPRRESHGGGVHREPSPPNQHSTAPCDWTYTLPDADAGDRVTELHIEVASGFVAQRGAGDLDYAFAGLAATLGPELTRAQLNGLRVSPGCFATVADARHHLMGMALLVLHVTWYRDAMEDAHNAPDPSRAVRDRRKQLNSSLRQPRRRALKRREYSQRLHALALREAA